MMSFLRANLVTVCVINRYINMILIILIIIIMFTLGDFSTFKWSPKIPKRLCDSLKS